MITDLPPVQVIWTCPVNSRAMSPEGQYVNAQSDEQWRRLRRLNSIGSGAKELLNQLFDVHEECAKPGWDGYEAEPVTKEAYANAYRFIEALPLEFPAPSISAEPDGHITFEWYSSARRTLSVSVSPEGEVHYAALIGAKKSYGTEPFSGEIPQEVLSLARRVTAA